MRDDLFATLENGANDLYSLHRILSLAASLGDWDTVLRVARDLRADRPEHWTLVAFRVRARAERGEWENALDDLAGMQDVTPMTTTC